MQTCQINFAGREGCDCCEIASTSEGVERGVGRWIDGWRDARREYRDVIGGKPMNFKHHLNRKLVQSLVFIPFFITFSLCAYFCSPLFFSFSHFTHHCLS